MNSIKKMNKFYKTTLLTMLFLFLVGIATAGTVINSDSIIGLTNLSADNITVNYLSGFELWGCDINFTGHNASDVYLKDAKLQTDLDLYDSAIVNQTQQYEYLVWKDGSNYYFRNQTGYEESSTNASYIIQSAVNGVATGNHGSIFVKSGTYLLDYEIILPLNFYGSSIIGENWRHTILKANSSMTNILSITNGVHRICIEGINFNGDGLVVSELNLSQSNTSTQMRIERIATYGNCTGYSVDMSGNEDSVITQSLLGHANIPSYDALTWEVPFGNIWISTTFINGKVNLRAQTCTMSKCTFYESLIYTRCQYLVIDGGYFGEMRTNKYIQPINAGGNIKIINSLIALDTNDALIHTYDPIAEAHTNINSIVFENINLFGAGDGYLIAASGNTIDYIYVNGVHTAAGNSSELITGGAVTITNYSAFGAGSLEEFADDGLFLDSAATIQAI